MGKHLEISENNRLANADPGLPLADGLVGEMQGLRQLLPLGEALLPAELRNKGPKGRPVDLFHRDPFLSATSLPQKPPFGNRTAVESGETGGRGGPASGGMGKPE